MVIRMERWSLLIIILLDMVSIIRKRYFLLLEVLENEGRAKVNLVPSAWTFATFHSQLPEEGNCPYDGKPVQHEN